MQVLFMMWNRQGTLVRVECLQSVSGVDVNATARTRLREMWRQDAGSVERCTIYLLDKYKLTLLGGEAIENRILTQ